MRHVSRFYNCPIFTHSQHYLVKAFRTGHLQEYEACTEKTAEWRINSSLTCIAIGQTLQAGVFLFLSAQMVKILASA